MVNLLSTRAPARARVGAAWRNRFRVVGYRVNMASVTGVEHEQEAGVLVRDLCAAMAAAGDPAHVEQRCRYLKSAIGMCGVGLPQAQRIARATSTPPGPVPTESARGDQAPVRRAGRWPGRVRLWSQRPGV